MILCVVCAKGHVHDFTIFKESDLLIAEHIEVCVDLGYQGIKKLLKNVSIPDKKPKGGALTPTQKAENTAKSKKRIPVEHLNRKCKIFRIVKETFRGKHKNMAKTWNLIAGLVNFRYVDSREVI
jgi:hypothetical protein